MESQDSDSEESFQPWDLFEEQKPEHIDIADDSHVEGGPAKKKQRRAGKKVPHTRGKKIRILEQGLLAVQTQMAELVGVLSKQQGDSLPRRHNPVWLPLPIATTQTSHDPLPPTDY